METILEKKISIRNISNKKKFNIKDLMKNTDFEAQRRDPELQAWNNKPTVARENI